MGINWGQVLTIGLGIALGVVVVGVFGRVVA